jgi:hypothetical protein
MTNEKTDGKKLRMFEVSVTLRHEASFIIPAKSEADAKKKWLADNWGYEECDGIYDMCTEYDIETITPMKTKELNGERLAALEAEQKIEAAQKQSEGAKPSSAKEVA